MRSRRLRLQIVLQITFLLLPLLSHTRVNAQVAAGTPLWTNYYGQSGIASGVATDPLGNIVVIGYDYATILPDFITLKYSPEGLPLWTNRFNSSGDDEAQALAIDNSGTIFVTGSSTPGSAPANYVTLAYSSDGILLWNRPYNGSGNQRDFPHSVAVDNQGKVIVTGSSWTTSTDFGTIAYSTAGVPLWTNLWSGPGNDSDAALAVAIDKTGKIFVAGGSMPDDNSRQFATIAYSSSGSLLWSRLCQGTATGFNDARAIALDNTGNVFVTGYTTGATSTNDFTTVAYSNSGLPLWTNLYNGTGNGNDNAAAIAVDGHGNVFITGTSDGADSGRDYVTIAYSNSGVPLWTNRYDGANRDDIAFALALDADGNVFVTGSSIRGTNNYEYATLAYSNSGVPLWTNRYSYTTNGHRFSYLSVAPAGNIIVTGSTFFGTTGSIVTLAYASSLLQPHLDIHQFANNAILTWTNSGFTLQSAPAATGPYTNVPAATSPWTNALNHPSQFFRLSR